MGSFVGDVDVNDMVNYMAVPLNSFKRQHLKADDIINSMNEVSNKHAVEMTDLGQAYSKASAVVSATGTSFAQLTGMITGAQEATRAGGDVAGRPAGRTDFVREVKYAVKLAKRRNDIKAFVKAFGYICCRLTSHRIND